MKTIIVAISIIMSCNSALASNSKQSYDLKFLKVQENDVAVHACTIKDKIECCERKRLLRDFNPKSYPSLRSIILPTIATITAISAADAVVVFISATIGWTVTPFLTIAGFAGSVYTLANFKYAHPNYYLKGASLKGSLNLLDLKKVGDAKLLFYRDQSSLDLSIEAIVDL